jgi:hypothetical protein
MDPYMRFLDSTWIAAQAMQAESDVMRMRPLGAPPPSAYRLIFDLPFLRLATDGTVEVAPGPVVSSLYLPPDYLHSGDPSLSMRVLTVDTPGYLHPNVNRVVCLGCAFQPGAPFRTVVSALYSILSYGVFCADERNALNPLACRLLRQHGGLLEGLERRPLLRRGRKRAEAAS